MRYILLPLFVLLLSCNGSNSQKVNPEQESLSSKEPAIEAIIEIDPESLLKMLKYDKNAFVVDVRPAGIGIRSCKMIRGYKHIEDSLIYKDPKLLPENKSIILLSKTGLRSRKLAVFLSGMGYTVYNLKKGMDSYWSWREKIIRDKLNIYSKEIDVIELYADDFGC